LFVLAAFAAVFTAIWWRRMVELKRFMTEVGRQAVKRRQ